MATVPNDPADARWSPDGEQIVFSSPPTTDQDSRRLFLVNADGSDVRQITSAPGVWWDIAPVWSPDGKRIAFLPYERLAEDQFDVRPLRIYTLADGTVTDTGPIPRDARAANPAPGDVFVSAGELVVRLGSRWDIADRVSQRGVWPPSGDRRGDRRGRPRSMLSSRPREPARSGNARLTRGPKTEQAPAGGACGRAEPP